MNGGRNLLGLRPLFIFTSTSSAPNDFSISCKRFFVLLRMIFHSVANDFPVDGSLLSGQRQHTNSPTLRTSF